MKTILFVAHSGTLAGGGERSLLEMVLHTHGLGRYDVHVALPFEDDFSTELKKNNVPYHVGPIAFSMYPKEAKNDSYKWQSVSFADSLTNALDVLLRVKPDLILTNTVVIPWFYKISRYFGVPNIVCIREMYDERNGVSLAPSTDKYLSALAESVDYILYNSQYTKNSYKKFLSHTPSTIVYPTVNIPKSYLDLAKKIVPLSSPTKHILVIGNITEHKNQLEAVKAMRLLVEKFNHKDISLTIMGNDGNEEYVRKLTEYISKHSLEPYVRFKPFSNDPYEEMVKNDIILMTSHNEAFGRVTLEGQLLGKVVVGASVGGTIEIIENKKTGLLYKPDSIEEFAGHIDWCIAHPADAQKIAAAGQKAASKTFALDTIFKDYDTLLASSLASGAKPTYDESKLFGEDIYSLITRNRYMNEKISEYSRSLDDQIRENEQLKNTFAVKTLDYSKELYHKVRKKIKR